MAKKYTVIDAPRRVRMRWAKKAAITRRANKKLRECKAKLSHCKSDVAPILHRASVKSGDDMRRYGYMSPELSISEPRAEQTAAAAADYVGYGYGMNPRPKRGRKLVRMADWDRAREARWIAHEKLMTFPSDVQDMCSLPPSVWAERKKAEKAYCKAYFAHKELYGRPEANPGRRSRNFGPTDEFLLETGQITKAQLAAYNKLTPKQKSADLQLAVKELRAELRKKDKQRATARKRAHSYAKKYLRTARNPELMVVHNPGRTYRSRAGRVSLSIRHRRNNMRRRKSRNLPLTVKIGGKRRTYRGFIKSSMRGGRMTMKQAARRWKRSKKFHGYSKKRVSANRKRRRSRNSWKGNRRGHARAAKKGWRKRKSRGSSRRRKGSKRRRCAKSRWAKLVKKYGVKKAKRHYHCKRRNKRRKK